MDSDTTVPPAFRDELGYLGPKDVPRLMASLVALGAEVFLLKAEIERLRRALETAGTLAPKQLESAASDAAFKAWLDSEQSVFARHLLDPLWRAEAAANTAPNSEPVVPSPADAGAASRGDTA